MTAHYGLYQKFALTIFSILRNFSDPTELRIVDAILIKETSPTINIKYNEMSNLINLYK